ncbi:hypothetical protein [Paenibacillus sp. USHLN196]|uniref:hypothetical protein n=1 Tax=Paenibacillus sp. USHLN196 TaxID=3081291 RepID=UPI003018453F
MKNDIVYALMSLMDGVTIFMFAFGCFKISFKDYWKEILVTNLIISIGTFFLKGYETILGFVPVLCFALLVLSLTFYFRIKLWESFKLACYGFVAQIVAQFSVVALFMLSSGLNFTEASSEFGSLVQLLANGFLIVLTLILRHKRIWFSTMSYDYSFKIKLNKINIFSTLIAIVIMALLYNVKTVENIYLTILFWGVCLINLMYIDIKKEKSGMYD